MSTELVLAEKFKEISTRLNGVVLSVLGSKAAIGFEKAYIMSTAIAELKASLTPEYMKPIMALQGQKLGFKTDQDAKGGYNEEVVKSCLIDAVLIGLEPVGNQFNIISGNMYPTREGLTYLLNNIQGLTYEVIPQLPRINADKSSAAVVMGITWTIGGEEKKRDIEIPVKMNSFMGTDAVIGKAHRKARMWLFNTLNGTDFSDGDVMDAETRRSSTIDISHEELRYEEIAMQVEEQLNKCTTEEEIEIIVASMDDELKVILAEKVEIRKTEINKK